MNWRNELKGYRLHTKSNKLTMAKGSERISLSGNLECGVEQFHITLIFLGISFLYFG
jgi:hypothetical protein